MTRIILSVAAAVVLAGHEALAQATQDAPLSPETSTTHDLTREPEAKAWSFSVSAYTYIVPDMPVYEQPTITADHGWLHLEARYNYEALETGSMWVGYNFEFGQELAVGFTPMIGGVVGDTTGVAPGYSLSIDYEKLAFSTEGEYVFDTGDSSQNFFYVWSELSVSPKDWFRVGLALQRTKVYQTDFDVQRGFLLGFTYESLDFTAYLFNPTASEPTVVLGLDFGF